MKKRKLTEDDVKHLAQLSSLDLSDRQIKKYQQQINEILSYVDLLNEVDTSSVVTTSHTIGLKNRMAQDETGNQTKMTMENLRLISKEKQYFSVKRIM